MPALAVAATSPGYAAGYAYTDSTPNAVDSPPAQAASCAATAAFSTVVIIKRRTLELEGPTNVFEDIGASGKRVGRRCCAKCAKCGSRLTTEPDAAPQIMFIKAGGIDNNEWFQPAMELFVTRRRPWVSPVPGSLQFDGNPPI